MAVSNVNFKRQNVFVSVHLVQSAKYPNSMQVELWTKNGNALKQISHSFSRLSSP